jgi:DNA-binding beta-propeller fold protein YncE
MSAPADRALPDVGSSLAVLTQATMHDSNLTADQGCERFGYQALDRWPRLPAGWGWTEVAAVATDSHDRVYAFNRGPHPVIVFDRDGNFLASWGEEVFSRPHGIFIGPDDSVWCADDVDHTVRKFTADGRLLLTLGESGKPSDTGVSGMDYRTIQRIAGPFHYPTNLALSPQGEMYITDGYGNARVHKFAPDGRLLFSWGEPGDGPGQFHLPHGIAVDREGIVYVADRENSRVQLFTPDGKHLASWANLARPCQVFIDGAGDVYVAELGFRAGMWPGTSAAPDATGGRVSIFNRHGALKARWGGGKNPCAAGDFFAPHGICVDSHGDIYVAEVVMSAGGNRGLVAKDCRSLQKFVRTASAADGGSRR